MPINDKSIHIDPPLIECIESCATICVIECCGIDAIDSSLEQIEEWATGHNPDDVARAATQAAMLAETIADERYRFSSMQVNHYTVDDSARTQLIDFFAAFNKALLQCIGTSDSR